MPDCAERSSLVADRRSADRGPWSQLISCHLVSANPDETWWARVLDFSPAGIGLLVMQPMEPRSVLVIELHSIKSGYACTLPVYIRHCTLQSDGTWLVGCEFQRELSDAEFSSLQ